MKIEEMANVLDEYCKRIDGKCDTCAIERLCDLASGDFRNNPGECEIAYRILQKQEQPEYERPDGQGRESGRRQAATDAGAGEPDPRRHCDP